MLQHHSPPGSRVLIWLWFCSLGRRSTGCTTPPLEGSSCRGRSQACRSPLRPNHPCPCPCPHPPNTHTHTQTPARCARPSTTPPTSRMRRCAPSSWGCCPWRSGRRWGGAWRGWRGGRAGRRGPANAALAVPRISRALGPLGPLGPRPALVTDNIPSPGPTPRPAPPLPAPPQVDMMFDAACERIRQVALAHDLPLPDALRPDAVPHTRMYHVNMSGEAAAPPPPWPPCPPSGWPAPALPLPALGPAGGCSCLRLGRRLARPGLPPATHAAPPSRVERPTGHLTTPLGPHARTPPTPFPSPSPLRPQFSAPLWTAGPSTSSSPSCPSTGCARSPACPPPWRTSPATQTERWTGSSTPRWGWGWGWGVCGMGVACGWVGAGGGLCVGQGLGCEGGS